MSASKIRKIKVASGVYWVEIPQADLYILCGCPADAIKLLKKRGLVETVEQGGVRYETGPNAILLSEVLIQNGSFANLTEFPVMQMLYLQGMLLPNHPNNDGTLPLLIGNHEQVAAQLRYIYRGNYGLVSKEEMIAAGASPQLAEDLMRVKQYFSFGKITPPEVLLEQRIVEQHEVPLRNGASISREAFNTYRICYEGESVTVNLNLTPEEKYEAPYKLSYHLLPREYFAVIHSGEGNGWDINRPCMSSIVMFQGKIYLVDAGPNIMTCLNYLGISVNEIEGIFHTHGHDDHFAGLTTLARSDHRFKYYTTPLVRAAVAKKLCALMDLPESSFSSFFDIHDLEMDAWNDIGGLEVRPSYSPHPVETNLFFFRTRWQEDYKVYAHLADTVSLRIWNEIANGDTENGRLDRAWFHKIKDLYSEPADLKKVDIGGGLIHGVAEDYTNDPSTKVVLAHTDEPLSLKQREIGSSAAFGMVDVLIPTVQNYLLDAAREHLQFYFPEIPAHEINYLLNQPMQQFNAGSVLFKKGEPVQHVYLLLTGSVGFANTRVEGIQTFSAGSLISFYSGYYGQPAAETYWAASNIHALTIPVPAYREFINRHGLYSGLQRMEAHILFLKNTWLFGEIVSFPIMMKVARQLTERTLAKGETLALQRAATLYLIKEGEMTLQIDGCVAASLQNTEFFGGDAVLNGKQQQFDALATTDVALYALPAQAVQEIPIVYWKMLETHEKRLHTLLM